ncbi:hypothetical protein PCANC_12413 [Puccinia coronata f. sp. avenae]|uniref:Choline/carnitine acyltransferase domain-containing protein n=1 Tax=Puccinia coronata f. sp. avenae TaxID=200324 RepID=A0A2N5VBE3_9BASI|nr:hypothetical protein PCANC_12413 [Puccinia coronata f. sp. avenae]
MLHHLAADGGWDLVKLGAQLGFTIWSGGGENRVFDEHQLIVCENRQSGFNGEHSYMDTTPVARMNNWMIGALSSQMIDLGSSSDS